MGVQSPSTDATHQKPVISKEGFNLDAFFRHRSALRKHRQMNS